MLFFAFGETNVEFDPTALVVEVQRHDGITALFHFPHELFDFICIEQ